LHPSQAPRTLGAGRMKIRFWLRLFFYPLFAAAIVAVLMTCWAVNNLADIAVWLAMRSLPGFSLCIGKAELAGITRINLAGVELRRRKQPVLTVSSASASYSLADLWHRHIERVEVDGPRLAVDDACLAALPPKPRKPADSRTAWRVDNLSVRGGSGEVDLRGLPKVRFDYAAEFLQGMESSRATQRIEVRNIRVTSRADEPETLAEAKALTVLFTPDQLAQQRLQEVILDSPSIHLRPALLAAVPASSGAPSSPLGWQAGRLTINNGEVFTEGIGPSAPNASAKFAMDASDFALAGEKIHTAQLWDIRAAPASDPLHPILILDSAAIGFSLAGLGRNEVASLDATGLWVSAGRGLRSFAAAPDTRNNPPPRPWKVLDLSLESGSIVVPEIGPGVPTLTLNVKTHLTGVALSADTAFASQELQSVELSNIVIRSPLDAFVPVLDLKTVFVRFSLAALLRGEIQDVSILNPQIFVGEDLFWYADTLKEQHSRPSGAAPGLHWIVKNVGADFGQIIIANGGKSRATLPLSFSWRARNVDFDNLDDLQLKLKLDIQEGNYEFPSYQLTLKNLSGKIEFGLPAEAHQDNLVHTLQVGGVRWQRFAAGASFVSVTYDKQGIYGEVGGAAYGGYVSGGFSFFTQPDSPWTGWLSGTKVNLRGVTDALAPQSFRMTGPADFKLEVNGQNHVIERMKGSFSMRKPGKLKITKTDDLLAQLPPGWSAFKTSLTRIGLETLRDFAYDAGEGSFWFASDQGDIKLALEGATGSRKMEAVLHPKKENPPAGD